MDAGIASEDNLDLVKENGFSYIVVSRSKPEYIEDGTFEEIKEGIKVKELRVGDETYLHCISDGKMKKEQAIVNKARDAMEQEIKYLSEGLTIKKRLKSYPKVLERIGRLRQRYSETSEIISEGSGANRSPEATLQQGLKGIRNRCKRAARQSSQNSMEL